MPPVSPKQLESPRVLDSISDTLHQAATVTFFEATMILVSIGFGVGYIEIFWNENKDDHALQFFLTLLFNLIIGIISVQIFYNVKQIHKGKLGST